MRKFAHLEQITPNGLRNIGLFRRFVYFSLCECLQFLGYSYSSNRVIDWELDSLLDLFTYFTIHSGRFCSDSKIYRTVNTSSLDEIPASWRSKTAYSKSRMRLMAYARQGLNSRIRFRDRSWRSIISGPLSHQAILESFPAKPRRSAAMRYDGDLRLRLKIRPGR